MEDKSKISYSEFKNYCQNIARKQSCKDNNRKVKLSLYE